MTTAGQMIKVLDELVEAEVELRADKREEFLIEMIDVLHSAAGVLYKSQFKYTDAEIAGAIQYVQMKNKERGYYLK